MSRPLLVVIAAAALLCAGYALGAGVEAASADMSSPIVSLMSVLAICVSATALAVGILAAMRAKRAQADVERMARSVDATLRGLADGNSRNSSALGLLTDTIDRQIGGMLERIDIATSAQPVAPAREIPHTANNVVTLGAPGRRAGAQRVPAGESSPLASLTQGDLELSLEPIIAVSQSAAAGFEVYAHVPSADGAAKLVRRLHQDIPIADRARFELALVKAAMHASRRQLPGDAAKLGLYVAVSEALLADADATAELVQLFEFHPGLAGGLILSLPIHLLVGPARSHQNVIARLAEAGVRLAGEGWPDTDDDSSVSASGASILKLTSNRLLDRDKVKRKALSGSDIAELAHSRGLTIIATDVATDEDAVALLDLGIDLMSGARFSPPRRLRPPSPETPGKVADG